MVCMNVFYVLVVPLRVLRIGGTPKNTWDLLYLCRYKLCLNYYLYKTCLLFYQL